MVDVDSSVLFSMFSRVAIRDNFIFTKNLDNCATNTNNFEGKIIIRIGID